MVKSETKDPFGIEKTSKIESDPVVRKSKGETYQRHLALVDVIAKTKSADEDTQQPD